MPLDPNPRDPQRFQRNWQRMQAGGANEAILDGIKAVMTDGEQPSGTVNGTNKIFTLAFTPDPDSVKVYLNGQRLKVGSTNDYEVSGSTITFVLAPQAGDVIQVDYLKASV